MSETLRQYYLQQMGIHPWTVRKNVVEEKNLTTLDLEVSACIRCPLSQTRKQTVFARGNPNARLMIIGEAPGFHEDEEGLPFVGKAGGLLNSMLTSIEMLEHDVYMTNVLKCRPPNNRDPNPEEISQCCDYLTHQIDLVKPKIILAVGCCAGQFLLKVTIPLNKMRGKLHNYNDTPVVVSYHPAYLLRNPVDKKNAYQDLLFVKQVLIS